ncbi:MAG: TetR/AcrR family transcriptional regulator [Cyclobacteriaceae bacterium]|jgi:AcrR family transcriptional regulator|nr:TetR/AcrR family transcriptional regulator [Cyclobacteriaceae bacterium]
MVKSDIGTEKVILEAAKRVFHERGLAGARMQQIADEAGINKALLHYYFRNKEQLFKAVFTDAFAQVIPQINEIFDADQPLLDKIRTFAVRYTTLLMENHYLPGFIIQEINNNPNFAAEYLTPERRPNPQKLLSQIREEVEAGRIRPVEPLQLVVNLLGLCLFPFIAAEMIRHVTGMSKAQYQRFLAERQKHIPEFVINAITP